MGYKLKYNKQSGTYRMWNTIVDEFVSDNLDRDGIIRFLFWDKFGDMMHELVDEMEMFPHGWTDYDTNKRINIADEYDYDKLRDIKKNYHTMMAYALTRLKTLGISIDIVDKINGYTTELD